MIVAAADLNVRASTPTRLGPLCKRGHDYEGTGRSLRHGVQAYCIACAREDVRRRRDDGSDAARFRLRAGDPFYRHHKGAQGNARIKGLPFSLTVECLRQQWERQGGRCYWLGLELDSSSQGRTGPWPTKATLDRLVPELGYVPGNVVWASAFANHGRGTASVEEFTEVLRELGLFAQAEAA